jgi:hypothetical protein
MSEEKIIKHSAHAVHVLRDKEKGLGTKLKEFFVEVLIIVFAVSITLLFHNWNDERHERQLEREFLTGIKADLDSAAADLKENATYFQPTVDYFINLRKQIISRQFNAAFLDSNSWAMKNTLYFTFDMGRFEAFKSSGYLRLIQNQALLKRLMTLYTVTIPFQIAADHGVFETHARYYDEHIGPRANYVLASPHDGRILASRMVDDPYFRYMIIDYSGLLEERKMQKKLLTREMNAMSKDIAAELGK